jgi:hypothetical protein
MEVPAASTIGAHIDTSAFWKGFGVAMSSSPWEGLWKGDEDVATPSHAGAVSGLQCIRRVRAPGLQKGALREAYSDL